MKAEYWAIFDTEAATAAGTPPGQRLVTAVQARIEAFAAEVGASSTLPRSSCLRTDCEQLITYLRFPAEHHKRIRHSNFIERTFGETRRRVKVIGRLPGEPSCLNLVWAVLDRASRGWRGVTTTSHGTRQLQDLRRQLSTRPPQSADQTTPPRDTGKLSEPSPNIHTKEPSPRHLHRSWDATWRRLQDGRCSAVKLLT